MLELGGGEDETASQRSPSSIWALYQFPNNAAFFNGDASPWNFPGMLLSPCVCDLYRCSNVLDGNDISIIRVDGKVPSVKPFMRVEFSYCRTFLCALKTCHPSSPDRIIACFLSPVYDENVEC